MSAIRKKEEKQSGSGADHALVVGKALASSAHSRLGPRPEASAAEAERHTRAAKGNQWRKLRMGRFARPTKDEIRERRRNLSAKAAAGQLRLPEDLNEIRMAFGRSQEEFAALMSLTRMQIAEMERGVANPTYQTIMRIGRLFGFRLAFMPAGDDPD